MLTPPPAFKTGRWDYALGGAPLFQARISPCGRGEWTACLGGPALRQNDDSCGAPRPADGWAFRWADCSPRDGATCKPRQLLWRSLICCCLANGWINCLHRRPPAGHDPRPWARAAELLRLSGFCSGAAHHNAAPVVSGMRQRAALGRQPVRGFAPLFLLDRALLGA